MTITVEAPARVRGHMQITRPGGMPETRTWDPADPAEVAAARAAFEDAAPGALTYATRSDGGQAEVIRAFDPDAQSIVVAPQIQGG